MATKTKQTKSVDSWRHGTDKRRNIPTAEFESVMSDEDKSPVQVAYARRNRDLDPQLVWRGKDEQDWSDLVVQAPPLYIQEKVHPKVLIEDLLRQSKERKDALQPQQLNLFADFNGLPAGADSTEFYKHEGNWTNRMILGDSLQVMASLAEREGLRGKVQCIYLDPPYGIKFNSNFQWSTTSRDVKDGSRDHITREPEQVKAFRDTWRDGIHSYLTYLRDRLTVARDLLTDSGSIFVQIGDENVHRLRVMMDEVFGAENCIAQIPFRKKLMPLGAKTLENMADYLIWYARNISVIKYRQLYIETEADPSGRWTGIQDAAGHLRRLDKDERRDFTRIPKDAKIFGTQPQWPPSFSSASVYPFEFDGVIYHPAPGRCWVTTEGKMQRLTKSRRLFVEGAFPRFISFHADFPFRKLTHPWHDTAPTQDKQYVVETNSGVVQRCILMTTDPGDLVLDPTCGSGTTAYVAEQWGRRWITIDTSRVALALARARIMGARYPYYFLKDSKAGQLKEAEITHTAPSSAPTYGSIRQGFVYQRVPHITLKAIANNAEIDVIWERYQETLEPLRQQLNKVISEQLAVNSQPPRDGRKWKEMAEWEIPREAEAGWPAEARTLHAAWWQARIARQQEIDASIQAKADQEFLYDKPYEDSSTVRVAGPFTVESLSPHRILVVDEAGDLHENKTFVAEDKTQYGAGYDFTAAILENLRTAGVQQAHKEDRITFTALTGWPGQYICAEGRYLEGENQKERRAGIFIGPEFGTVGRADLVAAAREAAEAGFDVLIACAFNYDAHSAEFEKLGRIPVLKARMNADLHMADTLKSTGAGNLFVIFGEPDIEIEEVKGEEGGAKREERGGRGQIQVRIRGVDVFHPQSGQVVSSEADDIACWFIDTNYNEESFFVRHAYFLGANDPYQSLKTTLKAEIDQEAWESLHSDVSRPFNKPENGRIAVKVINHLGDEVMKVFTV